MKKYIKLFLIVLAFTVSINSTAQGQKIIKEFDICTTLTINGPAVLDAFSTNVNYNITNTLGPLPSGYTYVWSTSNNSGLQIISGNGTSSITVNYTSGEIALNVSLIKDAASASCCMSKTITQADAPANYTIVAISCPTSNGVEPNCTQNSTNWSFRLVDENGNNVGGSASWPYNPTYLGMLGASFIDNINSTSGTTMFGSNSDCYGFTVICIKNGIHYYGNFGTPDANPNYNETCNSRYANESGYFAHNNTTGTYTQTPTNSRQTLIDNNIIN